MQYFCIYRPNVGVLVNFFRQIFVTCSFSYMLQSANSRTDWKKFIFGLNAQCCPYHRTYCKDVNAPQTQKVKINITGKGGRSVYASTTIIDAE